MEKWSGLRYVLMVLLTGFSRQEYWSGLPCSSSGNLPQPGIEPMPPLWQIGSLPLSQRVSWTVRRSNQSILKEISPEYSLEGLMLKLKLQYSVYLM